MRTLRERLSAVADARHRLHVGVSEKARLVREVAAIRERADLEAAPLRVKIREREESNLAIRGEIESLMQEGRDARRLESESEERHRNITSSFAKWRSAGLSEADAMAQVKKEGLV